eukprot:scaffold1223_cov151-Amphora_coffeaeformis.AAC.7
MAFEGGFLSSLVRQGDGPLSFTGENCSVLLESDMLLLWGTPHRVDRIASGLFVLRITFLEPEFVEVR